MTDCDRHQSAGARHEDIVTAQSLDRRLIVSIGLNGVIVVAEVVGGFASGSLALLADASMVRNRAKLVRLFNGRVYR